MLPNLPSNLLSLFNRSKMAEFLLSHIFVNTCCYQSYFDVIASVKQYTVGVRDAESIFSRLLAIWSSSLAICLVTALLISPCPFLVDLQGIFFLFLIPLSLTLLGMKFFQLYFLPYRVACKDISSPNQGSNPGPWQIQWRFLTAGLLLGNSLQEYYKS